MKQRSSLPSGAAQFRECVAKEVLTNVLSFRYPLVLVLTVASALFVTAVRTHVYRKQVVDYRQAARDWRTTMASVRWTWQSVGIGLAFEKPPEPLAVFTFGLENEMTRSVKFSEYYPDVIGLRKLSATSFRYFSQIDIATVMCFGCSLLALMLVFDSVTAARERGTLRLLLSGPVPRSTIILGKIAAGLITLAGPLLLAWGLCIAYVMLLSGHGFSSEDCIRIAGTVVLSILYVATIFALGLAASCWASSSNASLVLALFSWLLLVLFLPSGAKAVSDLVYPIPSFASIEQDNEAIQAAVQDDRAADSVMALIVRKEPGIEKGKAWDRAHAILAEEARKFQENLENRARNNVRLFGELLHISPAWSFLSSATALAGTGAQDYLGYLRDVRLFRLEFARASEVQKAACEKRSGRPWWEWLHNTPDNPFSPELWPDFHYEKAPLGEVLPVALADCAWMAGFMVLFLIVAVAGFVRSEV